jgi:hypothetical protein
MQDGAEHENLPDQRAATEGERHCETSSHVSRAAMQRGWQCEEGAMLESGNVRMRKRAEQIFGSWSANWKKERKKEAYKCLKTRIKGYRWAVTGPVGENAERRAEKDLQVFENCELESRNVYEYEGSVVDG